MALKQYCALLLACLLTVGLFSGCQGQGPAEPAPPADYPVEVSGTLLPQYPTRVLSLSPSLTQTLVELGLGGRLVGIGDYCPTPPMVEGEDYRYQQAGIPAAPNMGTIRRLKPNIVFTTAPMTNDQLTRLQQENIDVVVIPPATTLEELRRNYTDLFRAMWGEVEGNARATVFLQSFDAKVEDIGRRSAQATFGGQLTAYVTVDLLNLATGDTIEGELLRLLNLANVAEEYTGYVYPKELEKELDPQLLLSGGMIPQEAILTSSCYKTTQAVKEKAFFEVDGRAFEWQAPSMLDELWKLGEQLDGEAFACPIPPEPEY